MSNNVRVTPYDYRNNFLALGNELVHAHDSIPNDVDRHKEYARIAAKYGLPENVYADLLI